MKFGISQPFPCSYLDGQEERLLVYADDPKDSLLHYETLIQYGFRRSGEQIYRPHCEACNKCHSLRIPVNDFALSKSQKRIANKNKDLDINYSKENKDAYFTLFERYINQRHQDGDMHPTSEQQYTGFCQSKWMNPLFIELWHCEKLVGVAVTDDFTHGYSAMYTFFDPDYHHRSLGKFAILKQIELCIAHEKPFLYLGYQIEECQKMRYKSDFYPHQLFFDDKWHHFTKNNA